MKFKIFILGLFSCLVVIAGWPVWHAVQISPPRTHYSYVQGLFEDYYYYLMVIRQGRFQLFQINQYTTDTYSVTWIHIFYSVLGRVTSWVHISATLAYQLAMYGFTCIFFIYAAKLVRLTISNVYLQMLALGIIFLCGPLMGNAWWTRMDAYSRLSFVPHHIFAISLIVMSVYYFLLSLRKKNILYAYIAAACVIPANIAFGVPGFVYLSTLVFTGILAGFIVWRKGTLKKYGFYSKVLAIVILASLFSMAISYIIVSSDSFVYSWEGTTFLKEQEVYTFQKFLIGYGILPLFFIPAVFFTVKRKKFEEVFLLSWALFPLLFYVCSLLGILGINKLRWVYTAPYLFGGMTAVYGMNMFVDTLSHTMRKLFWSIFVCLVGVNVMWGLHTYWWPKVKNVGLYSNIYIADDIRYSMEYLEYQTPKFSKLMTNFYTGTYIPAYTYNRVYIGHEIATPSIGDKWAKVSKFYSGAMTGDDLKVFFRATGMEYVYWQGNTVPQQYLTYMKLLQTFDTIRIYQVIL